MMMMMTRTKITKNLLIQYNSLHKEITLQNALRYNFAACIALCLSPCRFSESEKKMENLASAVAMVFPRRFSDKNYIF